jgi:hypothetical protein
MNPRRSRSRDKDFVMGELGGPAITTTSLLAPLLALLALRFLVCALFCLHSKYPPVPTKATSAAVSARFRDTHSETRCWAYATV